MFIKRLDVGVQNSVIRRDKANRTTKKRGGIGDRAIQRRHAASPQKKNKPTPRPCVAPALALAPGRGSKVMDLPKETD